MDFFFLNLCGKKVRRTLVFKLNTICEISFKKEKSSVCKFCNDFPHLGSLVILDDLY